MHYMFHHGEANYDNRCTTCFITEQPITITEALHVSSQSGQYNKAGQKSSVAIKDSPVILDSVPIVILI